MKRTILSLIMVMAVTIGFSQHSHSLEEGMMCSHVKSSLSGDFSKYLYNWQSPLLDNYDVTFYHLDIEVSNTDTYVGGNVIINANAVADIDTFAFELKDFHTITQIFVDGVEYTAWDRENDNVLVPITQIPEGNSFSAQIYYGGTPPTGGFFSGLSHATSNWGPEVTWTLSEPFAASDWFPVKQDLEDKADSVWVFLTTESSNIAGSQGLLTNTVDLGNGYTRYEWKSGYPIAYYLISFAVSEYQEYNIYAHPEELTNDSILIQNFIYDAPGVLNAYKSGIDATAPMVELFSDLYILYPFWEEKYGHCLTELGGGMEHQTMTTMGGFSFGLVAHELGHMWFGDNVTCATWSDIWINEGFATYSNYLAEEFINGWTSGQSFIKGAQDYAMSSPGGSVYIPIEQIFPGNEYRIFSGRLSYNKGAAIIHMLRHEMDSDSLFFLTMETFQTDFTDSTATGEDFKNTAEEVTGREWNDFFDQWYYGEGYPIYDIEYYNYEGTTYFSVLQSTSSSTPFFDQHVDMRLYFDDASDTLISFHQNDNLVEFDFYSGKNVMYIQVDPYDWNMEYVADISVNITEIVSPVTFRLGQDRLSDKVTLYFSEKELSSKNITITDISGKVVYRADSDLSSVEIRTSEFSNGIYLISASNGNSKFVEKFVK